MLIEWLWDMLRGAVETVLGWLPDAAPPDMVGAVESASPMWGYLGWGNKYAPVVETLGLLATFLLLYVGMFIFRISVWVLTKAHVLGGAD